VKSLYTLPQSTVKRHALFLNASEKLRKLTISFCHVCSFVCPSVRVEKLGFHFSDFHEI